MQLKLFKTSTCWAQAAAEHPKVTVYLDQDSASLLNATLRGALERHAQVGLSSDCS